MSGLFGTISIALRAMQAQQAAIAGTSNNIANINTPNYSRQVPIFEETDPTFSGNTRVGSGVALTGFRSIRDDILELRLQEEQQQQGQLGASLDALKQLETSFPVDGTGLDQDLSKFFSSLSTLSGDPANLSLRQGVLSAAQKLANSFRVATSNLQNQQSDLDVQLTQAVGQVNELTSQIAVLNGKIAAVLPSSTEAGAFVDQRNQLIQQLSQVIDVTSIKTENSLSLTTGNGTSLVVGNVSYRIETQMDSVGHVQVVSDGQNITTVIRSGQLAGLIEVRDSQIPGLLSDLDRLAYNLVTQFNLIHANGFDLNGQPGSNFFVQPAGEVGSAATLTANIADPTLIAASGNTAPGGNANLLALADLQKQPIINGSTPISFYSDLVFRLGSAISYAQSEKEASDLVSQQLADQRGAISGVSLNEEASNLIRFQRAFEAAARVVDVISSLTDVAVNLGRS